MSTNENDYAEDLVTDIVIIGSGGGMAAAVAAAEKGANVIVLERQKVAGGNTRLAFGLWACESPVQERENIRTNKDEYFKIAMKWAHWHRVNPRVVRAYIDKSGDTIRWLEEKGVEFDMGAVRFRRSAHAPIGTGKKLMAALIKTAETLGVEILLQTRGNNIIRDQQQGNVKGVIAEKDGREFEIKAKSVIIATGGFPGNIEMLKKYCPDYYDGMYTGNSPFHTGDGITMAQEAGAEIVGNIPIFHVGPVVGSAPRGKLAALVKDPYAMWVNKTGRRFIDESGCMLWECGNAILMQPDRVSYCLFDDDIRKHMEERGIYDSQVWEDDKEISRAKSSILKEKLKEHSGVNPDEVKVSDSLDEMAAWIGADPRILKSTIDEYNNACDEGRDSVFVKDKEFMIPLRTPPYYAVKGITDCGETMGGIRINEHMEAQDINSKTIPGIYIAGIIADGWESQTYCCEEMAGSAYGFAINSGRIAGENAASFALKNKKD